ncbi:hypothetical protein D9619_013143 [Psilocybe cf. subviscida]|uniref:Protein kinase domain-containing protein n=1 Tax=Psilocybe cf. subviscida TaxID=2480587 RepID=A0A8H5EZA7_9AGAR|nr:hypothetical protein D9619_013143 [Psilocybe cf. subviscida]
MLSPPRAPTEQLRLESFKTVSRLRLVEAFRPWLDFSKDYVKRPTISPYFQLWDCICFGAPLNTLLELLSSPTPRHLAEDPYECDFDITHDRRLLFFQSFIQRVQNLETQGRLPFGEVLRVEDFTTGTSSGFSRILRTLNRVLRTLEATQPDLYSIGPKAPARRASLVQQLLDSEHAFTLMLAKTADHAAELYAYQEAAHPSVECFVLNCARLILYHQQVHQSLEDAVGRSEVEQWEDIFSYHNKPRFLPMTASYRSICSNYISFQRHVKIMDISNRALRQLVDIVLHNISCIISRFSEYHTFFTAVLDTSVPSNPVAYDSLCVMAFESGNMADTLAEIGHELRTMWCHQELFFRLTAFESIQQHYSAEFLVLDDCLVEDPGSRQSYCVFLFKDILLCCSEILNGMHTTAFEDTSIVSYPIKPWQAGPALTRDCPLKLRYAIPTNQLSVLHCIDSDYFQIKWGVKSDFCLTFYPDTREQYEQWVAVLEPFVSTVHHSTTLPQYVDDYDGASVYSGVSVLVTEEYPLHPKPKARPWSIIGRKGTHSESSSVIAMDLNDKASILSPNLLPTLFRKEAPLRSPLGLSFPPDDKIPLMLLTESPLDMDSNSIDISAEGRSSPFALPDLTEDVAKNGPFAIAHGGYSDIWTGVWKKDDGEVSVAVKALRISTSDPLMRENLVKRLQQELRIWSQLKHPHVLELCGTVSNFGPYVSMVCPWMKNGSITKYLERSGDLLSVKDRLKLIVEIADGLAYCEYLAFFPEVKTLTQAPVHSCSIVHGDLTGSNVLIDDNFHAQLCDFGLSTLLLEECEDSLSVQSVYTSHLGGSVRWADAYLFRSFEDDIAPPLIGTWNDIYSFGSIMLEVLSGRMPYHYLRNDAQVVIQLHQGIKPRRPASTFVDDDQWELIQSCWQEPPQKRPSANDVLTVTKDLLAPWTQKS